MWRSSTYYNLGIKCDVIRMSSYIFTYPHKPMSRQGDRLQFPWEISCHYPGAMNLQLWKNLLKR